MTDLALMQQALDALEIAEVDGNCYYEATELLRKRLAQPEQEPVAWMYQCTADNSGTGLWVESPLYTTPPAAQQPLMEPEGRCKECFTYNGHQDGCSQATPPAAAPVQPEQEPVAWPCEIEEADFEQDTITLKMLTTDYVIRAGKHWLSTTPPAAQPEPVVWKNAAIRIGEELSSVGPDGYYNMTAERWLDWAMDQHPQGKNSLTTPPAAAQRQWVDLTDDMIEDLFQSAAGADEETHIRFARAIEQALKEKNT